MGDGFAAQGTYLIAGMEEHHRSYLVEFFGSRDDEEITCDSLHVAGQMLVFRTGNWNAEATEMIMINSEDVRRVTLMIPDAKHEPGQFAPSRES